MDESERKEFGLEIQAMRRGQNLTQEELATRASVSLRTIRNLEAGKNELQAGNLSRVLDVLGYKRPSKPWDEDVEAALMMWGYRLSRLGRKARTKRIHQVTEIMLQSED